MSALVLLLINALVDLD